MAQPPPLLPVSLDDKWTVEDGRVLMNGTQALARVLLAQGALDRRAGLRTAGYISGYRGSPLGNVDTTLWSIAARLKEADIVFQPGLNEDIAATALRGTQQLDAVPDPAFDGVFAAWYSKGPGVDRSGDALKHGNYAGTHHRGGVLLFYGDDHGGKSSTVAHQSEQALAAHLIPSLYPATAQEIFDFGLLGYALSRYSGSWVGIKCMNEVAEQTSSVEVRLSRFMDLGTPATPLPGVHLSQGVFNPLNDERLVVEQRLPRVQAFVRAQRIDRTVLPPVRGGLGVITAGKSYGDVRAALALLGLSESAASAAGISLYKVGCIWPLEPEGIRAFAAGQGALLVVEEKKSFLELQLASLLINQAGRPVLLGKVDEHGAPLLSTVLPLDAVQVALAIVGRLAHLNLLTDELRATAEQLPDPANPTAAPRRTPYFCSGCPHNRSTRVPEGSFSMTGIGCHTMANFVDPAHALLPTQMGGEGGNWIGLSRFTRTPHMFQNMGDGTYYHSGLLAIRAAVAARVNITFKILYNDAVAMTGGQPVDGPLSVARIAAQLRAEGVSCIYLLSDAPDQQRAEPLPPELIVRHRDELDAVQRLLRETPGCTALIYEQTCAAEKRRRRKRGKMPDPPKRLFIAHEVCEGCGDCSVQSSCMSLVPRETALGRKRAIDQSSCNKDYSCLNGFCPSFITVYDAAPRPPRAAALDASMLEGLPPAPRRVLEEGSFNVMIAGIGGTGVITVGALLGTAAHMEGLAVSLFDMTGLSQKNGAVYTHARIARHSGALNSQRIGRGETDLLLAFDLLAGLSPDCAATLTARSRVIANAEVAPTMALQFQRDLRFDAPALLKMFEDLVGAASLSRVDATGLALALLGDTIGANLFLLGMAVQRGLLPVGETSIEAAIRLNAVAVDFNVRAFRLGRLYVMDPARLEGLRSERRTSVDGTPASLAALVAHRSAHLRAYQDERLATRYQTRVAEVERVEAERVPGDSRLARAVAHNLARVLAPKDEYEVARLLTLPSLRAELQQTFADGGRVAFNLAPPFLGGGAPGGRPRKREFGAWLLPLLRALARLRFLRGTRLDPFGWNTERRAEREFAAHYEALIGRVLAGLRADNHADALAVLGLADTVRGFGPVKQAALEEYYQDVAAAEAAFRAPRASAAQPAGETRAST